MNKIDLVVLRKNSFDWKHGNVFHCDENLSVIAKTVTQSIAVSEEGYILFVNDDQLPNAEMLDVQIEKDRSISAWYDVHSTGKLNWPNYIDFVSPVNYFNMACISDFSNILLHGFLINKKILMENTFLDERFSTVDSAMKEWVYRSIYCGVLFQHYKLEGIKYSEPKPIAVADQLRFIKYRFGTKWFLWCAMRSFKFDGFLKIKNERSKTVSNIDHSLWRETLLKNTQAKVTVLIPTVERYPYLKTVLKQLGEQTILPFETIVIDQTPKAERQFFAAADFSKINLKYFEMEEAGQCSSRNFGLNHSSGDYILFIDDDVEFESDLIEKHLKCIQYFNADVSCGVCDEVGAGPVPKEFTMIRHSEVFPTNNGMIKREILKKSGLFDLAYDKGQRADGDLGARVFKSGARMILNPAIRLLHHHAPCGGLRKHKARTVTFASSRQHITHFRMPHITELYFAKIHCSKRQQREQIILLALGTFSIRGGLLRKAAKVFYAALMVPSFFYKIYKRNREANKMLKSFPQVPTLQNKN